MKRRLLWGLVLLAGLLGLGYGLWWLISQDPGYVLLAFKGFRYQSSLWAFLALLLVTGLLGWALRRALRLLLLSLGVVNPWSRLHRGRRLRLACEQGLLDLAEGRWQPALRHLRRAAEGSAQPLPYYLGAARAAEEMSDSATAEQLLARARERQPKAELAIALTQADLQAERGDWAAAQATLQQLRDQYPAHPQLLRQLQRVLTQRADWSGLLGLLPDLIKAKALPAAQLQALQEQAWQGRLLAAGQAGGEALATVQEAWQQLHARERQNPLLLKAYAGQLQALGADEEAESVLRTALKRSYTPELVALYGQLRGRDSGKQLQLAESWLKQAPQDAQLLLCLGRLCLRNQLWGKAREYLEASLQFARQADTCIELARLLASQGDLARSNQLLQEAVQLRGGQWPSLPLPSGH